MSRSCNTIPLVAIAFLAVGASCKGQTKFKDNPETLSKLESCTKNAADKDELIKSYTARIAELERGGQNPGEIVVRFEGDILTVSSGRPGTGKPAVDDKVSVELSRDFTNLVQKSRGAIQKCYEQALKKNTGIQGKTITMTISATFAAQGDLQRSDFSPNLGDGFDVCMKNVASKWKLKPASTGLTFRAPVSLTPS